MKSGSALKRVFWPLVQRPAVQVATCFHATATSEYEDIRNAGFRQPVAVIPNGVDIPEDQPRSRAAMRTLLFLGRIHPKKGIDMLLLAWARVEPVFTDWQLRIVGPDNAGYLDAMKRRAAELKLERVRFAGPVYGDRKWDEYRSADLFVLPTHSENFGLAVAEALATGVPAIVTRGAPWADLERQGAGWWIDIGVEPLFAALDNALGRGRADLDAMGQRGRAWISTAFSWSQAARQMGETYEWIVRGGSRPACVRAD
jgi:glycosyltransferase involved in cell wall biosynthesis